MSSADKQGFTKGDRPAQANSVPVASPIPSAEHDVISITEVSTAVAIVRATSRGTQLLFMQRGDSKEFFKLPKGQVQEGEAEERAAERIALQEAGVRGIHVQASVLGQLQCKPKKIYQDQKVVRVIHETIRVFIATPTDVFDFESRDGVNLIWIFQDDVKMLIAGNFVDLGGRSIRLHAMYIQHMHIGELALNRFAVAVPFVQAKEETSGGGAKRGVTTGADNASFIRFFAALDFEATCWNGPDGRVKQDAEAEIIEFPTVLYRVVGGRGEGGDCLQEVGRFHRFVRPVKNPVLSEFCTTLTGITQDQVDAADPIDIVLRDHALWLADQTSNARSDEILFVTDGDADLGEFLKIAERITPQLSVPPVYGRWSDIKVEFCKKYKKTVKPEEKKLKAMLKTANICHEGQLHSGLDDSINVGHLLQHLWEKGLRVFTSYTESQFRKRATARVGRELGGGGGAVGGGGGGGAGAGSLKFGSLNILEHSAFIKWSDDYGLDEDTVKASREWRFDNVVQTMRDIDCDVWGVQEVDLHAPELANRLGYTLYSHARNDPANKKNSNGVCILLRPQLVGRVVRQQPLQFDCKHAPVAGVTLELGAEAGGGFTITLLTTHLKMNYPRVSDGLTNLGAAISALGVDVSSTVVMGDFNVDTPEAQRDLMERGQLSPCLASFSVGLEATPLLPDNLLIGCNVPRFAVGVCAYVPTLLLHAKGSPYKEEFNRSIMSHRAAVSDHYPILFKIAGVKV